MDDKSAEEIIMKVIAIIGSAHKNGNTGILIQMVFLIKALSEEKA